MANRYFINGGVDNLWGSTSNWATQSAGTGGQTVPTGSDDVFFDANSPNCTIGTTARTALSVNCTGYTNTLTFNTNLTITGNLTLGSSSMVLTGSSTFIINKQGLTTLTLSSGGCTCSVPLQISKTTGSALTVTMATNWVQSNNFTLTNPGTSTTFNGNTITFTGNSTLAYNNTSAGSTTLLFAPSSGNTLTVTSSGTPTFQNPITINGAGTINLTLNFTYNTSTFTYTAGIVNHTGTITTGGSSVFSTSGMSFQNGATPASGITTITLSQDIIFSNNFTVNIASTINGAGRRVIIGGSFNNISSAGSLLGTATILMNGTGTISGVATNATATAIEINTAGTITFSGTIAWLRFLTFTAGTIALSNSTITSAASQTFTLNAPGFLIGTFSTTSSPTFTGTNGCTINSYTSQTATTTHTFQSGNTYTILNSLNLLGTAASALAFRSGTASSAAIINLQYGATLDVGHVTATDVNSSGGQTIWNYKGTLTRTTNWQLLPTIPKTIGKTWVS